MIDYKKFYKNSSKKKFIFCILAISIAIVGICAIKMQENQVSILQSCDDKNAKIKVASGTTIKLNNKENNEIEINNDENIQDEYNSNSFLCSSNNENVSFKNIVINTENIAKSGIRNILKMNKNTITLNTKDVSAPNNVENVDTKILENTMIINFDKPKDNGTKYSYLIKNKNAKEKNYNFYSESGVKGYSYEINNDSSNLVNEKINKLDDSPLVLQNIDWNKNYYLHIKTIDNNYNESKCKTIKLALPSQGLRIRYIDGNTNNEICNEYRVNGNANDEYNILNQIKQINGYTLIGNVNNATGKLKKDQINIDIKYAKTKDVTIEYYEENTNNKLKENTIRNCYEGEKIDIDVPQIQEYKFISGQLSCVVKSENNVLKLYYAKIQKIDAQNEENANNEEGDNKQESEENKNEQNQKENNNNDDNNMQENIENKDKENIENNANNNKNEENTKEINNVQNLKENISNNNENNIQDKSESRNERTQIGNLSNESGHNNKKNSNVENKENNANNNNEKIENVNKNNDANLGNKENITNNKTKNAIENNSQSNGKIIKIKYIDFDTNKVLHEENINVNPEEKKVKIKMFSIKGYEKMENNGNNENQNIMDEIKESLIGKKDKENLSTSLIKNVPSKQEYEILMNCDQSDYIIYYKKQ